MAVADEQAWGLADVEDDDDDDTGIGSWAAWNSECGRDTPISTSTGRQDGDSHWVADEVVDAEAPRRRVSLLSSRRSFAYFMGQAKLRATPRKKNRVRHIGNASEPRRAASGKSSNAAVALFGQRGPPSGAASGKLFADNAGKDTRRSATMGFTTGRVQQHSGTRAAGERASSSMVARRNISQPRTQRPTPNDLLSPLASRLSPLTSGACACCSEVRRQAVQAARPPPQTSTTATAADAADAADAPDAAAEEGGHCFAGSLALVLVARSYPLLLLQEPPVLGAVPTNN
jgi:hypothetical protein